MDDCYSFLNCTPTFTLHPRKSILYTATKVAILKHKVDCSIPLFKAFQWFPITFKITFKLFHYSLDLHDMLTSFRAHVLPLCFLSTMLQAHGRLPPLKPSALSHHSDPCSSATSSEKASLILLAPTVPYPLIYFYSLVS